MILRAGENHIPIKSYEANRFVLGGKASLAWLRKGALLIACDPNHTVLFQAGVINRKHRTIEVGLDSTQIPGNCSQVIGPPIVDSSEQSMLPAAIRSTQSDRIHVAIR